MNAVTLAELSPAGIVAKVVDGLPDAEVVACTGYTDRELHTYLGALEARMQLDRGMPPAAWGDAVACTCIGCGPVLLWADCPPTVKACPRCFRRTADKSITRSYESLVVHWAREDAQRTSRTPYYLPKELQP